VSAVDFVTASYIKGLELHRKMEPGQIAQYLRLDPAAVRQVLEGALLPGSTPALDEFLPAPVQIAVNGDPDVCTRVKDLERKIETLKSVLTLLAASMDTTLAAERKARLQLEKQVGALASQIDARLASQARALDRLEKAVQWSSTTLAACISRAENRSLTRPDLTPRGKQ
jgi:hypothetical protein